MDEIKTDFKMIKNICPKFSLGADSSAQKTFLGEERLIDNAPVGSLIR